MAACQRAARSSSFFVSADFGRADEPLRQRDVGVVGGVLEKKQGGSFDDYA